MFDKIDKLQEKIAKLRPLNKTELEKLRENFIIENTYNSNAISLNSVRVISILYNKAKRKLYYREYL